MNEKIKYICDKCQKEFSNKNECFIHESSCGDTVTIFKYELFLSNAYSDKDQKLQILKYKILGSKNDNQIISNFHSFNIESDFDIIKEEYGICDEESLLYVYTLNSSSDNEKIIINKLIQYAKNNLLREKQNIEKALKKYESDYILFDTSKK